MYHMITQILSPEQTQAILLQIYNTDFTNMINAGGFKHVNMQ